jgi:prepilin signal peptidase PulO-like enzyme (type II secretory pathway)
MVNWLADVLPAGSGGGRDRWRRIRPGWRWLWVTAASVALFAYPLVLSPVEGGAAAAGPGTLGEWLRAATLAALLLILVVDVEHRRVLNVVLVPVALMGLGQALAGGPGLAPTVGSALLGGTVGLGLFALIGLLQRGGMGAGDVKLAGVIGILVGFPQVLPALLLGILAGGGAALWLLAVRRSGRRSTMPYAPYLVMGAWTVLLHGSEILAWYGQRPGA